MISGQLPKVSNPFGGSGFSLHTGKRRRDDNRPFDRSVAEREIAYTSVCVCVCWRRKNAVRGLLLTSTDSAVYTVRRTSDLWIAKGGNFLCPLDLLRENSGENCGCLFSFWGFFLSWLHVSLNENITRYAYIAICIFKWENEDGPSLFLPRKLSEFHLGRICPYLDTARWEENERREMGEKRLWMRQILKFWPRDVLGRFHFPYLIFFFFFFSGG
jgi:hypothetical protein